MLAPAKTSRQQQTVSSNPLYIPRMKMKAGTRAFSVGAPALRNSLLASVKLVGNIASFRQFKKSITLKLPVLLRFLASFSIRQRLMHGYTITRMLNPLVLSHHWAQSLRMLVHKKSSSLLLIYPHADLLWFTWFTCTWFIDLYNANHYIISHHVLVFSRNVYCWSKLQKNWKLTLGR